MVRFREEVYVSKAYRASEKRNRRDRAGQTVPEEARVRAWEWERDHIRARYLARSKKVKSASPQLQGRMI